MDAGLVVNTLGRLEIRWDGERVSGLKLRKARALLAYLALNPGRHDRGHLIGLLWGDWPEERARRSLRQVLWHLRQHLAPAILDADRLAVGLSAQVPCQADALAFEAAVERAGRCQREGKPATATRHLEAAVALYQGEFLARFDLPDCPAFEEWLLRRRAWLHERALETLAHLVAYYTQRGEYDRALRHARHLLTLDPWREETHRDLMRLLALTGQHGAALAQYEECRRLLETELGLEPLEETTALYGRLVNWELVDWEPSVPIYQSTSLPFTGREEEHATLVNWWETSQRGAGRLALVAGEAGVGKTRLVEEVIRYAEAQGTTALRGRCYEFGSGVPYQPIADALRSILDSRYATPNIQYLLPNVQPVWLAELSRLLPELRSALPDLPEPMEVSGEAARQRLFEAVARFLQAAVGGRQSAIVFLDDLHWADTSTLDLLHYLVRQLASAPVWLVGPYRLEEVDLSHPLARLRQGLSRDHLVDLLSLEPLSPAAVGEIARSLAGEEAETDLGAFLYRESEGNPFFLVEAVSDLQEQGALRGGEDGCWQWAGPPEAGLVLSEVEGTLPTGVRDVVLQRVGRLGEPAQRLLTLAAVIGQGFDVALLGAAAGRDADAVDESLDEWLTRRLVQLHSASALQPPTHNLQYDFSHDKIRAAVYHAAGPARRRMLHRRVGTALENLYADRLGDVYEQLAHHYEQAGLVEQALTYLPLAAAKSTAVYAHQEALGYYDRALVLLVEEDERRWEITLQRGKSLHSLAQYDDAIAVCQQVVRVESAGDRLLAARAANELSAIYWTRRDFEEARAWSERAYRLAGEVDGATSPACQKEQAWARLMLGYAELEQGNLDHAQGAFAEGLALYRALEDQRGEAHCLGGLGSVFRAWGQYDKARQRFEEVLAISRALGDSEAGTRRAIGFVHWRQGDNDAAHQIFTECLDASRAMGNRWDEAACLVNLGLVYLAQGALDEARRCSEESVAIYRSLGLETQTSYGLGTLGVLHLYEGDYAAAQQCLEKSQGIVQAAGAKSDQVLNLGWLGNLCLRRGEYDAVRRHLETALDLDREIGGSEDEVWHLIWLGAVACEMGHLSEAQDRLQEAIQLAGERRASPGLDEAHCWLVVVHLAQRDGLAALDAARRALVEAGENPIWAGVSHALLGAVHSSGLLAGAEDPVPHFERALALLGDNLPFERGTALRRYGAYLLRSGNPEQGRAYLQEAQGIFERIGARGELTKVTRLLVGDHIHFVFPVAGG